MASLLAGLRSGLALPFRGTNRRFPSLCRIWPMECQDLRQLQLSMKCVCVCVCGDWVGAFVWVCWCGCGGVLVYV